MIRENTFSETLATALRTHQYSQTSSVVTWLTADRGKLSTIVKGSYRPKSEFLGQHDLFYTCELIYYNKDRNGLHVAKEFQPVNPREGIRNSWRSATLASYMACLLCETEENDPHAHEMYRLTDTTLNFLDQYDASLPILFWFELQFLNLLGFAPQLGNCSRCSKLFETNKPASFSVAEGGLRCATCGSHALHGRAASPSIVQPDTLAVLRSWQNSQSLRVVRNTSCSAVQTGEISALLKAFLEFHVDFQHESRDIALKLLRNKNKRNTK